MAKQVMLTEEGLKKLEAELEVLKGEKRTEIAEKIKAGENPDSAIVAKMTELGQKITDLENTDFAQIYNTAKNTL